MVHLTITGLPARRRWMEHFRVDQDHSNAFESWSRMGSPQSPAPAQLAKLTADAQLQAAQAPRWVSPQKGRLDLEFVLPRHGVSLIRLSR
jgi:xylan 1,4-beta-xylosidase